MWTFEPRFGGRFVQVRAAGVVGPLRSEPSPWLAELLKANIGASVPSDRGPGQAAYDSPRRAIRLRPERFFILLFGKNGGRDRD